MRSAIAGFALTMALTGMALAHAGTKDPTVKAWMANMKSISAETKVLGQMARRQTAFDAGAANVALARIAEHARDIPALFETPADDPSSEARDLIWSDWERYTAEADRLTELASAARIADPADLRPVVADIGQTCKSCHEIYRD